MTKNYFADACHQLIPNQSWSYVSSGKESSPQTEQQFIAGFRVLDTANLWDTNPENWGITWSQVSSKIVELTAQEPFDVCKVEAKKRIAATDWSVLPDVGLANRSEFETYRAQLRALIINPVSEPTWPTEPEPVWS